MKNKRLDMVNKWDRTVEAKAMVYLQDHRGLTMRGETRKLVYELYTIFFNDGRSEKTCGCMDVDTLRKVDNYIMNDLEWSDEVRQSPRFYSLMPDKALVIEEISTQPVTVDLKALEGALEKRHTIKPEDVEKLKKPIRKTNKK